MHVAAANGHVGIMRLLIQVPYFSQSAAPSPTPPFSNHLLSHITSLSHHLTHTASLCLSFSYRLTLSTPLHRVISNCRSVFVLMHVALSSIPVLGCTVALLLAVSSVGSMASLTQRLWFLLPQTTRGVVPSPLLPTQDGGEGSIGLDCLSIIWLIGVV